MSRDSILSVDEAAELLSLNPSRVRALIVDGRIPAKRISHGYALLRSDVERFASQARPVGRPPAPAGRRRPSDGRGEGAPRARQVAPDESQNPVRAAGS